MPSGDPEADLETALALVNSVKNSQVAQEIARQRQTVTKRHSSGSGAGVTSVDKFEATPEELAAARIAHVKPENIESWVKNAREGKGVVFGTAAKRQREAEARR